MSRTPIDTSSIIQYLKGCRTLMSGKQAEYYQWVLDNGKYFKGTDRNKEMEKELIKNKHPHKEKACYYNSQMLLIDLDCNDFEYYEGWYIPKGLIPIEHGFIVHKGKVIDLTINGRGEVVEYFGVKIPTSFIRKRLINEGIADYSLVWFWESLQKKVQKNG